jgi:hypothetical protein
VWKAIQGSCELNWTSTANGKGGRLVLQLERENRGEKMAVAELEPTKRWWNPMDSEPIALVRSVIFVDGENTQQDDKMDAPKHTF